jgi:hypothetical protein
LNLEQCAVYPGSSSNLKEANLFTLRSFSLEDGSKTEYTFDAGDDIEAAKWIDCVISYKNCNNNSNIDTPMPSAKEAALNSKRIAAAKKIYAWFFVTMKQRRMYLKTNRAIANLQTAIRSRKCQARISRKKDSLVLIQTFLRQYLAKLKLKDFRIDVKVKKLQPYRTRVLMELYSTEETYVEQLDTLHRVFYKPLKALYPNNSSSASSPKSSQTDLTLKKSNRNLAAINTIGKEHIQTIFSNFEGIMEKHKSFLSDLKSVVVDNWSESTVLSKTFFEMVL